MKANYDRGGGNDRPGMGFALVNGKEHTFREYYKNMYIFILLYYLIRLTYLQAGLNKRNYTLLF